MKVSPLPRDEKNRLEELYRYQILDSESEKDFDDIVALASQLCNSPMAAINLIDEARQWSKAKKGLSYAESDRSNSFCSHTIHYDDLLMVTDTLHDDRFFDNPHVIGNPWIRFYAGVPLITKNGFKLGSLCVLDRKPKQLTETQSMQLRILGNQVVKLMELRLHTVQLENQIQLKTTELSHVFDRMRDAFITLDRNWKYTYVNRQLGDMVKREPQSLIGKNVWEEFPSAIGSSTYHAFHLAMKERKYVCHVDYYEPLNLWQENHIYPSPNGLSVFIRDITDQKQAEKKLIESLEHLERAEEQAKMGSWSFNIITGERFWSRQLFLMFGFHPNEEAPDSKEFLDRVHPEDRQLIVSSIENMRLGQKPGETIIRTNPEMLPLRYILGYSRVVTDEKGTVLRFEGTMLDITELQKTNQELDRFVYSVSHDLRAPLSTILGLINLVELEHPEAALLNYFKTIRDHVNRLDGFIEEILNYSMNARTEVSRDKINFTNVLNEIQTRIQPDNHSERIKVDLAITGENKEEFYTDRSRLEIILNNLYSNSIKYQDFHKENCHIKIDIALSRSKAVMTFSDNGIGIDSKYLGKIFNMFYRASDRAKGSGLGLYIVKETVAKLGGNIRVKSEFGQGTTFTLIIPNLKSATIKELDTATS